jgi:hypothetical protein
MIEEIDADLFISTLCEEHFKEVLQLLAKLGSKSEGYGKDPNGFFVTSRISGRWKEEQGFFFFEYYMSPGEDADFILIRSVYFSVEEMPDEILDIINIRKKEHTNV